MSKWFIRAVWLIPALLVNLLLRSALEPVLNTSGKVWVFQTLYFAVAIWIPCVYLPKRYSQSPRAKASRIAKVILAASSDYCKKAMLPDRMTVHLQVWCVYVYAVILMIKDHPVSKFLGQACCDSMFVEYNIGRQETDAREAFLALHTMLLRHLASVNFDPLGSNPISYAFNEFWLESFTKDSDGIDLFPQLESAERDLIYKTNLTALMDSIADILNS